MRGITREALVRMDLESESWEYASEMVLKSVHMGLRTAEVPVRFLKDRDGRLSHHKRAGWFSPWQAAWINLRAMFVYGSDFFLLKPGLVLVPARPPVHPAAQRRPDHDRAPHLLAVLDAARHHADRRRAPVVSSRHRRAGPVRLPGRATDRWLSLFSYNRSALVAAATASIGLLCLVPLVQYYLSHNEHLTLEAAVQDDLAVTGLTLMVIGFSLFTFTLVLHGAAIATRRPARRGCD